MKIIDRKRKKGNIECLEKGDFKGNDKRRRPKRIRKSL